MRDLILAVSMLAAVAQPAFAQSSLALEGFDRLPVIEAEINGRTLRLAVDPRMPDALILNAAAAERVRVRSLPMMRARLVLDDASLLARLARPEVVFANGEEDRITAIVFTTNLIDGADGVIGPGALPYERISIGFAAPQGEGRARIFTLTDADAWTPRVALTAGDVARVDFNIVDDETVLNPPAVNVLQRDRLIVAAGDLRRTPLIFGLSAMTQPATVDPSVTIEGLAFGETLARTNAPMLGPEDDDALIVEPATGGDFESRVSLGRQALAHCWSISVDPATRQLTLLCAD